MTTAQIPSCVALLPQHDDSQVVSIAPLRVGQASELYLVIDKSRAYLKNLVWAADATEKSTHEFLTAKAASADTVYGIYVNADLVGTLELRDRDGVYELGYWLGVGHRGQGVMVQAVEPLVTVKKYIKPVTAHIRAGNHASMSVLTRSGLTEHHREMWQGEEWIHYSTCSK